MECSRAAAKLLLTLLFLLFCSLSNLWGDEGDEEIVITATRLKEKKQDSPGALTVVPAKTLSERSPRSMPEALTGTPSVMVQKTAHGQGSPYIRGFTGFQVLHLIDGIRLNNSVFRSGPNQYFSTIDPLTVDRLETVRGPASVLYGSDAVGGVINVIPRKRISYEPGFHWNGTLHGRYASAEDSFVERLEVEGNAGERFGFLGGLSLKDFGDLSAGRGYGVQEETGYSEVDGDFRLDWSISDDVWFTLSWQRVDQYDVPRTHKTIYNDRSYHGTTTGNELRRDLDQSRELLYARLAVDRFLGFFDRATLTLSNQEQSQERDRLRTGSRRDISGFDVNTAGLSAQLEKDTSAGIWSVGTEYYHDDVDSFRRDYVGGSLTMEEIQGPVGDRAEYDLLGAWLQNRKTLGPFDLVTGIRHTRASAHADRVDNPLVGGSDPAVPGNVIAVNERYGATVGSLRGLYRFDGHWRIFGGLSQGFRAPNLSDLTAFDATSAVETPSPGLEPEYFLAFETGLRARYDRFGGELVLWKTFIDDMIVQSPTGNMIGGDPEVRKDNVGDGYLRGIEAELSVALTGEWTALGMIAFTEGRVDQFELPSGRKVTRPVSRVQPLTGRLALRYDPPDSSVWVEIESLLVDRQDKLALRDETDTSRIPPGGTPGYTIYSVRGGVDMTEDLSVTLAVENLTDKNYRVHGSGVNEAGTNFVFGFRYRF